MRVSNELVRSQTPQGAGLENLCPGAYLIRPPCCQSHQNTKCAGSHPNASISGAPWGWSRVQALLVAVGAHVSLQGEICFTQAFLLSAGIAAAWPPRCWLAVQQFAHAYCPSCFPSSSFAVLDSLLLCSPSPFSRGSIRNGSYSSWRSINAAGRANRYGCLRTTDREESCLIHRGDQDLGGCVKGQ